MTTSEKIESIRQSAHQLHESVNQHYDKVLPYSIHLDMTASVAERYAREVLATEEDYLPLMFAAYYHDSIEDARLSYNDVTKIAKQYMTDSQAFMAAEIVYALTNEKGRTRAERAGEKYYAGIRATPYAPFTKLCDRIANVTYSHDHASASSSNNRMRGVYLAELPHFLNDIDPKRPDDKRFAVPEAMVKELYDLLS